jgi:mono/diheme cytochrome c family protein
MRRIATLLTIGFVSFACAGGEPPEEVVASLDSIQLAREAFDPTMFDTVSWESREETLARGQVVYRFSCLKCHGEGGLGDGGFVRAGDTLKAPSFREATWVFAGDKAGIREQVFVGTAETMPHWGLVGLGARDVDAVASYILEGLPER